MKPVTWRTLLAALERADRFGFDGSRGRATAWAHVFTEDGRRTVSDLTKQ